MLKVLGALLITGGLGAAGYLTSFLLAKRASAIRSFVDGLTLLSSEIGEKRTPLPRAAALCARETPGAGGRFWEEFCRLLDKEPGEDLAMLYRKALFQGDWGLEGGDLRELAALGPVLGRYYGDIQVQAIAQCQKRLERNLLAAEQEVSSRGRIARAAGFSAGIALALLVI